MFNTVHDAHDRFVSFQVVHFCDNRTHNKEAPNDQNRLCNLQSTWDVILQSSDFAGEANPSLDGNVNTTPSFRVLQQSSFRRFVLVLDTSGSMDGVSFCFSK